MPSTACHYGSYTAARSNFREMLDAAHSGRVTTLDRENERYVVADAALLQAQLARLVPSRAVVVAEGGGWTAILPGTPLAGEGDSVDDAVSDLLDALREYAEDWNDHLRLAPNHLEHASLVLLVDLSTDEQLRAWIEAAPADVGRTTGVRR